MSGQDRKQEIRTLAKAGRRDLPAKDELSRRICAKFAALPEYRAAASVLFYVDFGNEVRTQPLLTTALAQRKRIAVPYCLDDRLELFLLEGIDELASGTFGIPEPRVALRALADRRVHVSGLDLIMVPGVAFDRRGGRLGHGKGYYDKLLQNAPPDTPLVALAFECQVLPEIPMQPHDVYMDKVITEKTIYPGRGRRGRMPA